MFMDIEDSYNGVIQVTRQGAHVKRLKSQLSLSFVHPLCTSSSLRALNKSYVASY